jgi:hypothetical protein
LISLSRRDHDDAAILFEGEITFSERIADQANVASCLKRRAAAASARRRLFGAAKRLLEAIRGPVCNYYFRSFPMRTHHLYDTLPLASRRSGVKSAPPHHRGFTLSAYSAYLWRYNKIDE